MEKLNETKDRLQTIINLKQSMAERLSKILFKHYLNDTKPKDSEEAVMLAYNYEDIQTLAGAVLDYEIETGNELKQLLSEMERGVVA